MSLSNSENGADFVSDQKFVEIWSENNNYDCSAFVTTKKEALTFKAFV